MPTYMLEGTAAVVLPARPLTVTLHVQGGLAGTLSARGEDGPAPGVVRPRPELLVLPQVTGRLVLRIEPSAGSGGQGGTQGGVFPQGARANVSITVNDPGSADPERAVLPPIDLAGLTGRDVLSVEPVSDGVQLRSEIEPIVRLGLGPLAEAARVAATEQLGAQRLPRGEGAETTILVDPSASFRPLADLGLLERALSVLEGVAAVIDPRQRPGALIAAHPPMPVTPGEEGLAQAVHAALRGLTPTTGMAIPDAAGTQAGRAIRYLVSDAVPPALRQVPQQVPQQQASGTVTHFVLIGHESAWRLQPPGVPATLLDLAALGEARPGEPDPLTQRPQLLRELVASLLADVPGRSRP